MKKSLIALAVLGSMVGAASAQSSVTLFGGLDLNVRYNKGAGKTLKTMGTDGIYSSRWGVRGVEDLGGGLKAGFWLESAINPDDGTSNSARFWHRRSSVSLMGDFGEVRLGRFLTNQFTAYADFDPFGTNGVGDASKFYTSNAAAINGVVTNSTRADNIFAYYLPSNLGGFYGSAEAAAGEGTSGNKYIGGRLGYAAGPLNVSGAYSVSEITSADDYKRYTLSGSYDLGVVKLMGFYSQNEYRSVKQKIGLIGASAPLGSGTLRASYTKATNTNQIAVGYIYDVSKRTALYTTVSRISNDRGSNVRVAGPSVWTAAGQNAAFNGADNGGAEVGIRHTF
jgi:predicted porin